MKRINLEKVEHDVKIGNVCGYIEPNIKEDCLFIEDGTVIGFYLKDLSKHSEFASKLAAVANRELKSDRVPKSTMRRSSGMLEHDKEKEVEQYSTILGAVPPKPHMRRTYPTMSSVHKSKSAQTFIKAMYLLALESEKLIEKYAPEQYVKQKQIFEEHVDKKWRFGNLFTSSISNYNISARFHIDNANIRECVNVIITKRNNSYGGNTTVPDYGATVDSADNSMLVYPAWKSIHGVTPIVPTHEGGYRNSLVFYPLKAFLNK